MSSFNAVYYPFYDPPSDWLRSMLLFYDKIDYIVPASEDPRHVAANKELFDHLPDSYGRITEHVYGFEPSQAELNVLSNALDMIAESRQQDGSDHSEESVMLHRTKAEIGGHSFLHHSSIAPDISGMLESRGLVFPGCDAGHGFGNDYLKVDRWAATLLVGFLADRCAERLRRRTLTSEPLPFLASQLGSSVVNASIKKANTYLASNIISIEIPANIGRLELRNYLELRERFQEVKPLFHHAVRDMVQDEMLIGVQNERDFEDRIAAVTKDFSCNVAQFRMSEYATRIKDWVPVGVAALGVGVALAGNAILSAVFSGVSIAVQVHEKITPAVPKSRPEQAQRVLAQLQADVLEPTRWSRIVRKLNGDVTWS